MTTVRDWSAPPSSAPPPRLERFVSDRAALSPEGVAYEHRDALLTYRNLDALANGLALRLVAAGVGPGAIVPIVLQRGLALPVAILSVLKAGGAIFYIDPEEPVQRRDAFLQRIRPVAILTAADWSGGAAHGPVRVDAEEAVRTGCVSSHPPASSQDSAALAQLLQTSGSTGEPKLVMRSHRMLAGQLLYEQATLGLRASDRHLLKFPASFRETLLPALAGGTAVIAEPGGHRDSEYLARLISERRISVASFVPSALKDLLAQPRIDQCSDLRQVCCGGEPMSAEIVRRFRAKLGARLQSTYTMTEADYVSSWACDHGLERPDGWLGRPTNMRTYVLDDDFRPVNDGEIGEIMVAGPALAEGYFNNPEATAERFLANPFDAPGGRLYRTGDLGRQTRDGVVYVGRADDQVKIGGQRIDLGEVDAALLRLAGVRDAAVAAWTSPLGDSRLVAHVVEAAPGACGPGLRALLAATLPGHMIPSHFLQTDALPRLANGKLDRLALPPPPRLRPPVSSRYAAPATPTERIVAAIWEDALWVADIGRDDHFFDLGGTSLMAMKVRAQLSAALDLPLSMAQLLIHPTVSAMASWIDQPQSTMAPLASDELVTRATRRRQALTARGPGSVHDR